MTTAPTAQNTAIATAEVAIKVITINGRQMSQSAFRQLLVDEIIADDGTFRGRPWGTVNYHPEKRPYGTHLHVVWQLDHELRHACQRPPEFPNHVELGDLGRAWLDAAIAEGWRPRSDRFDVDWLRVRFGDTTVAIVGDAVHRAALAEAGPDPSAARPAVRAEFGGWWDREQERYDAALADIEEARAKLRERTPSTEAEMRRAVDAAVSAERSRRQRHHDRWAELQALPQLFIAT